MLPRTFKKILIANRGEIAVRIMRTCRAMGIGTVGVYSDADVNAVHTRDADESVHLGAAPSAESYLSIEKVLKAARQTGAEAIHPGYGFLSESSVFAGACIDAGLIFIGPSPESLRSMGDKSVARRMAGAAGLPVVPGYDGDDQNPKSLREKALSMGLPVMVKASAGGGGKGMRVVRDGRDLEEALGAAAREANKAFGDGRLLIEKHIGGARHIEVQIIGDHDGNILHLFERDCSLQRRHQKVIEESPAPNLPKDLRSRMCEMAVALARSMGYYSAGTVEFLLSPAQELFFIEVNARLQVEHPVSEMVTGVDLVRLQIEIAEGRPLRLTQPEVLMSGHSIEARLYAEDPSNGFLPSIGEIKVWTTPQDIEDLRIDSGIAVGTTIGIHYDPLLAKLIVYAKSRDEALRKLASALRHTFLHVLSTNREFLIRLVEHPTMVEGSVRVDFIDDHLFELVITDDDADRDVAAAVVTLYLREAWRAENSLTSALPSSYRNNPYRRPSIALDIAGETLAVSWENQRTAAGDGSRTDPTTVFVSGRELSVRVLEWCVESIRVEIDAVQYTFRLHRESETLYVDSPLGSWVVVKQPRFPVPKRDADLESANAPMPGQVLKILIEPGQHVDVGAPLVILEAMKMEQTIRASAEGIVEEILVRQGELVSPGDLLVRIVAVEKERDLGKGEL